jgi:hypothetical protein
VPDEEAQVDLSELVDQLKEIDAIVQVEIK